MPAEWAEEMARGFLSRMEFGEPSPAEVRYMRASLAAVLPRQEGRMTIIDRTRNT